MTLGPSLVSNIESGRSRVLFLFLFIVGSISLVRCS
uniref:Uncharacterized protein n=1 Tax=Rhizophora mucronata TaxID=61149 RepID=A0A2P2IHL7_RHIMU